VEGRFPRIWMPSSEVRDLRQLLLYRHKPVTIRTRVKNELRICAEIRGVQRKYKLWSKAGQQGLRELSLIRRGLRRACMREPSSGEPRRLFVPLLSQYRAAISQKLERAGVRPLTRKAIQRATRSDQTPTMNNPTISGPALRLVELIQASDVLRPPMEKHPDQPANLIHAAEISADNRTAAPGSTASEGPAPSFGLCSDILLPDCGLTATLFGCDSIQTSLT
jgi:hypothetical protein